MSPAPQKAAVAPAAAPKPTGKQRAVRFVRGLFDDTTVQALICASLSFSHIHQLADEQGQTGFRAWLYPLSVDLLLAAAYKKLQRSIKAKKGRTNVVFWFLIALTFSVAANVATAPKTPMGIAVAVWPVIGLLGCTALSGGAADPGSREPAVEQASAAGDGNGPTSSAPVPAQRSAGNRAGAPTGTAIPAPRNRPEPLALEAGNRAGEPPRGGGNRELEPAAPRKEPGSEPAGANAEPGLRLVGGTGGDSSRNPSATPADIQASIRALAENLPAGKEKPTAQAVLDHLAAKGLGSRKVTVLDELREFTPEPATATVTVTASSTASS